MTMAKQNVEGKGKVTVAAPVADNGKATGALEDLAVTLEGLAKEAEGLGEAGLAKRLAKAGNSARRSAKLRAARLKKATKVADLVASLKAEGLTAEQIVAKLTEGGE
jgi:hypothetical protein